MASKVLVGGISPEGEQILNTYLKHFLPDATIEPLKSVGIKGTMKTKAVRADVIMVILDESLWDACTGYVDDVLCMDKVFKYLNDDGLTQYLISRFGKLDGSIETEPILESSLSNYRTVDDDDSSSMIVTTSNDSVEDNSAKDAKIATLQDKLAQSEMLVKNLTAQLEDSQNASDIAPFIEKIKDLEQTIAEKDAELQQHESHSFEASDKLEKADQVLKERNDLKAEIKQLKEDCADLDFKRQKAVEEKESMQKEFDTLQSEVSDLRETRDKLEEVTASLQEMTERCAALESSNSDVGVLQSKIEEQKAVISDFDTIKRELAEKELAIQNLQVDLDTKTKKVEDITKKLNDLSSLIDEKDDELQKKQEEIDNLIEEKKNSEEQLYEQITSLKNELSELTIALEKKSNEIADLEREKNDTNDTLTKLQDEVDTLGGKDSEISELQSVLAESKKTVKDLQNTINELNNTIATQEGTIAAYEKRDEIIKADKAKSTQALTQALKENEELTTTIEEGKEKISVLEVEVSDLRKQLSDMDDANSDALANKDAELEVLQNDKKKLENEVSKLRESLIETKGDSDTIDQLNNNLLEERRKNARISAELEVLRSSSEMLSNSDNLVEINKLKKEIEELKSELDNKENQVSDVSDEDLQALRQKCADLEIELVEKTDLVNEYQNGIFGQLANVALPKVAYDIKVIVPDKLTSKCIVTASGSVESNLALYQNLKRTCTTVNNKSYLIVDLVTDTSIDMAFGITNIQSPVKWLTGEQPYQAFLADTKFNNVKVLSTGLAYMNDLSLLSVDWVQRINELQNQFDTVIFNVGCLNNFVAKILFGSFTKIMSGHIIVKATPINLRTVILTLTGYNDKRSLSNVIVSCVNFDTTSSKPLYQKLVSKCQAQILKDADILRF